MDGLDPLWVILAGLAAGAINAVIGSGTLITFPVLLGIGLPPVAANATNTLGLLAGNLTAAWRLRDGLRGHEGPTARLVACSVAGAVGGAALVLALDPDLFAAVVPVLIAAALVLIVLQPRLAAALDRRRHGAPARGEAGPLTYLAIGLAGVYGGYFGAAQGIVVFAVLTTAFPADLPRVNVTRTLLVGGANATGAVVFLAAGEVRLLTAALLAVAAAAGGTLGAGLTRRLSARALRALIVLVGVAAIVELVV